MALLLWENLFYFFPFFLAIILFIQVAISSPKDIPLHYPSRITRTDDNDSSVSAVGILAQLISLVVFVFYILIILGLIKATLGLCCSTYIGEVGLNLLLDQPTPEYTRNTQFCMNVVFFLVLPFALFRKVRSVRNQPQPQNETNSGGCKHRMHGGTDTEQIKPEVIIDPKISTPIVTKKKRGSMDVYRDGNDSETQDTKYVLEQLHRSEQSLMSGVYACSKVSN